MRFAQPGVFADPRAEVKVSCSSMEDVIRQLQTYFWMNVIYPASGGC